MLKTNIVSKYVLPLLVVVFLLGAGAGLVLAGRSDNGEAGRENPIDKNLSSGDEEVSGVLAEQSSDDFLENGEVIPQSETPAFIEEEEELTEGPNSPESGGQYYKRVTGSNFQPRESDTGYTYYGDGCLRRTSSTGDTWFTADLQVPGGAIINYLRVYFYDNNTHTVNSELWAFDGAGGGMLIAEANSSGSPGYSSASSGFFEHTVDNINESLTVVVSLEGGIGNPLALCGIRIRYQYSISSNFLPAMLNMTAP